MDIPFPNIFTHAIGSLFIWLIVSLAVEKLVSLMEYHRLLFAFVSPAWEDIVKKLIRLMLKTVLPLFSSKSFRFSGHTFKYLTHFDFIFVYGMRKYSNFILFYVAVYFYSTTYWRGFVPLFVFCLLRRTLIKCVWLFLGCLFYSIDLCICLCARTIQFCLCSFVV